jgi:hypothetical protein
MNDLLKHFLAGAAISAAIVAVGVAIYGRYLPDWVVLVAFFMPLIAGVAKEYYDSGGDGEPSFADITLTWSGAIVVLLWKLIENFI